MFSIKAFVDKSFELRLNGGVKKLDTHPHWNTVLQLCETLTHQKHKAWLAGGCVRDAIRNVRPQDFDVATSATPDEVKKIFPRALEVGKAFGVMVIPFDGFQIEVASFRKDGPYKDGRRPESITLAGPEEDAKRRDFTVNALFYDPAAKKLHDFAEGQKDIEKKIIRCVGNPKRRFEEDHLRILRGVRFAAQLGFKIESDTLDAMKSMCRLVSDVSEERIHSEIYKLLKSPAPGLGLDLLKSVGLFPVVASELARLDSAFYWDRTKKMFDLMGNPGIDDEAVLMALFLMHAYDTTKHEFWAGEALLKRWKFSNQMSSLIVGLIKAFWDLSLNPQTLARKRRYVAIFKMSLITLLKKASVLYPVEKLALELESFPLELPHPFLTGDDLKALGVVPGAVMGQLLLQAMDLQLEEVINSKKRALDWAKRNIPQVGTSK
jgi:tRNA nucleotidyltransferase/poly(A) polymerase